MESIRLTKYSHGAGCGCKISPSVLDRILSGKTSHDGFSGLLVGNGTRDDAAVYDLGNGTALISTTDFFMPIVDDPYSFGKIAAANAISDIYAMGGKPLLAIAILGWPVNTLSPDIAGEVVRGGEMMCHEAGIPLAGGHSIDCPEPLFGLAVNGIVDIKDLKRNDTARVGDLLFLTKGLGVGILTTAEKKGVLKNEHRDIATNQMMRLNRVGAMVSKIVEVHAMTDVTGFGLLGHLTEMAEGSGLSAELDFDRIPMVSSDLEHYIAAGSIPGGTERNWSSYGHKVSLRDTHRSDLDIAVLADPQTSGGLLISVGAEGLEFLKKELQAAGHSAHLEPIGRMIPLSEKVVYVK